MSEVAKDTLLKEEQIREPVFSKRHRRLLSDPLNDNNPITVQILGICSALAITTQVAPAFVMAISVVVVVAVANLVISLMRHGIPSRIRMIVQLTVVAALVIVVDQVLKAFVYDVSKQLSIYVGLIITNCIVMGRLEAFAMSNKPWPAFLDGIGNGLGYGAILIMVAILRELFGMGSLFGYKIIPGSFYEMGYQNNGVMLIPAAALFIIGIFIWIQRGANKKLVDVS